MEGVQRRFGPPYHRMVRLQDGLVQMTEYGENLRAVANFSDKPVRFGEKELPACSVLMEVDGRKSVYTPSPEHT